MDKTVKVLGKIFFRKSGFFSDTFQGEGISVCRNFLLSLLKHSRLVARTRLCCVEDLGDPLLRFVPACKAAGWWWLGRGRVELSAARAELTLACCTLLSL